MAKLKEFLIKYRSVVFYLLFGTGTTLINLIVYYLCAHPLGRSTMFSTILAWFFSVLFAYVTNRRLVFGSTARTAKKIVREALSFFLCRLATEIVELAFMAFFVDYLGKPDLLMKFFSTLIVIILNYIASKWMIFRNKD